MKHFYIILLLISTVTYAQIPSGYYNSATGSGYTLKTQLKNIISNGHITRAYNQLYDGSGITNSQGYIDTHSDVNVTGAANYENDNTILDFYSENPTSTDSYNYTHGNNQCGNQSAEGDCYNREHLVPQSSFNSAFPMQSDIHTVIPTDGRVNNFRGSLPFGEVATPNWTSLNGSKRGSSNVTGYSGTVFEPIDEFKGDIARALLYFAVRYEDTVDGYTSFDMFNGSNDQVYHSWALELLLDWHYNVDPVDQREIERNNAAYNFQGNANPFVNHPEYANMIWNPTPDTQAPTAPTNLTASNPTASTVDLTWTASTDDVAVASYDIYIDNVFCCNTTNTNYTATGLLANTNYCFTVKAKDTSGNESVVSNQDCETTTNTPSSSNDLFFSEYIEGSSNNKVLEIANYTGSAISDLSNYTLKLSSNGNASWNTVYTFPNNASIANEDVYVIANGSSTLCTSVYNDSNNAITSFNGNDAIGLFKNDVLIDVIGDFNSSSDIIKDVTLVRKETIQYPNTTFTLSEWDSYAQNNCDNLGLHTQTLSINNFSFNTIKIYPNPVKGNNITITVNSSTTFEIYNILGKKIIQGNLSKSKNKISLSTINKGVYLIKLNTKNGSVTRKIIKL